MKFTPWRTRSELEELKRWFFVDATRESKLRGIQRVNAYLTRGSYVPHVIDYTARLVQCQLNDLGEELESVKCQYCMVLVRFVNGMLDPVQQSQFAIPLHTLAENIGFPSWFVELRHSSTHDRELPSFEMLRMCCDEALKWVWENYWNNDEWEEEMEEEDDADVEGDIQASKKYLEDGKMLESVLIEYFSVKKSLKENDGLWRRSNFVRSSFGEPTNVETAAEMEWIESMKKSWKGVERVHFVEYILLHCDEMLLEICCNILDPFDVRCLEWLTANYSKRIKNEDSKIITRFNNYKKLLKFVQKCCSFMDARKLMSNTSFIQMVGENQNYLTVVILEKLNESLNNSLNARRKRKPNEIDVSAAIEEIQSKGVKMIELELYNNRKRCLPEDRSESPICDILEDLDKLKSQIKKIKRNEVIVNWQEPKEWETKPFGCL